MKEEQNDISKMAADMEMIRKLQEKEDAKKRQGANGCAIFLVIILLFIGWLFLSPSEQEAPLTPKHQAAITLKNRKRSAFIMSHLYVQDQLKAPSTAKFISINESPSEVVNIGEYTFIIRSAVDSQNSFGAMIRSVYYCELKYKPGTDTWICEKLVIK